MRSSAFEPSRCSWPPSRRCWPSLAALLRGASILFVLGLWEWGASVSENVAFPTCSETLVAFGEMLVDGTFAEADPK